MNSNVSREGTSAPPVDIATMRASVAEVLPPELTPTDRAILETLTRLVRGHIQLIIPEIEQATEGLPADDLPRYCALASVREAGSRLDDGPGRRLSDAEAYVRRLGRSLLALCDHYETLTDIRVCVACDQPIRQSEASQPYGQVSPSGGAVGSGRIHEHCSHTVRIR